MPRYDGDVNQLWRNWISKGCFESQQEGYPFWSNMHHTRSYCDYKHLPNFLFLHYADMRRDLAGTIKRIGNFIDHELSDTKVMQIEKAVSFDRVKEQAIAESAESNDDEQVFRGGQATFINKGTDGRWQGVLDEADLKMYELTRDKVLTEDCAAWIEGGDAVLRT